MSLQQTLGGMVCVRGIDQYGGNEVNVSFIPANADSGYIFRTRKGEVRANLANASNYKSSILLRDKGASVITVEHVLATLYAYGIDNALIIADRTPSRSLKFFEDFGVATDIEVVPYFPEMEKTLCDRLDSVGVKTQNKPRRMLTIECPINTGKLSFEKIESGVFLEAFTYYPVSGERRFGTQITPNGYKEELSKSRLYAKYANPKIPHLIISGLASIANLSFGVGHGFNESNVFLPVRTKEEWDENSLYPDGTEIARHSIVDRLGALALLEGRLDGVKITSRFSGHANDLIILNELVDQGIIVQQ